MWNMEPNEIMNGKTGEGFIDRSKVRILLCDNDTKSSEEVFNLLCKCSYQVTSVRSPRQVIDALNAEGGDIDMILSEVDLPMVKGFKMLKHIMRDKDLRRIPIIMMSAQDEVGLVVKCLRLGAADYLVKPLRTNELLNLWTHMWRRRRMLGLAEKNIMNFEFDVVHSDPSDNNTNSTTFLSDDTDDKSRKSFNPENSVSLVPPVEDESNVIIAPGIVNAHLVILSADRPHVPDINEQQRGKVMSGFKKSELKIGQSSAFLTYVKSSVFTSTMVNGETAPSLLNNKPNLNNEQSDSITTNLTNEKVSITSELPEAQIQQSGNNYVNAALEKVSITSELPEAQIQQSGNNYVNAGYNTYSTYPYYHHHLSAGAMNNHHVMMTPSSSSSSMYHHHHPHLHFPPHNNMPPGAMASFPYYPMNHVMPPPAAAMHPWPPSYGSLPSDNVKTRKLDRREAALLKFRQKRKERCFDKKVRYVNRKKLAERRPRVRGQFVRKVNGISVDLNGEPTSNDFDKEEEDDDDDEEEEDEEDSRENNY